MKKVYLKVKKLD